jgi:negative regulator of replication initiation
MLRTSRKVRLGKPGPAMTILEVKLDLPERMARDAEAAGLLKPSALRRLLKEAMQRQAAQTLLAGAARGSAAGAKPLTARKIQAEVRAVRREREQQPIKT